MHGQPEEATSRRSLLQQVEREVVIAILTVSAACASANVFIQFYNYLWRPSRRWMDFTIGYPCTEWLWAAFIAALMAALFSGNIRRNWLIYVAMATAFVGILFEPIPYVHE